MASAIACRVASGKSRIEFLHPRIQAADNALQFGKFFHQFGRQDRFSPAAPPYEPRPGGRSCHSGLMISQSQLATRCTRSSLFVIAAQVFLEGDVLQPLQPLAQRMFLVGLPEEARIVEARPQHAFMAVPNDALRDRRPCSALPENAASSLPLRIFDRKIFLMIAHHRDQNFFGQLQKFRIEVAQNHRRPFGQIDDGIEQDFVFAPARAGNGASGGVQRFANLLFSLPPDSELWPSAALRCKPIPLREIATRAVGQECDDRATASRP